MITEQLLVSLDHSQTLPSCFKLADVFLFGFCFIDFVDSGLMVLLDKLFKLVEIGGIRCNGRLFANFLHVVVKSLRSVLRRVFFAGRACFVLSFEHLILALQSGVFGVALTQDLQYFYGFWEPLSCNQTV